MNLYHYYIYSCYFNYMHFLRKKIAIEYSYKNLSLKSLKFSINLFYRLFLYCLFYKNLNLTYYLQ